MAVRAVRRRRKRGPAVDVAWSMIPNARIVAGGLGVRLRGHAFELATAIAWALVGLAYILDAKAGVASPVGRELRPFDLFWSGAYLAACPMIVGAIAWRSIRFRVAGLTLLGTALVMHGIAATTGGPLEVRDGVYFVFALACLTRALLAAETVRPILSRRG